MSTYVTSTNSADLFVNGRGDMGRTPVLNRTDLLLSTGRARWRRQAAAVRAERAEPLQPEDDAAHLQLPEQGRRSSPTARRRPSICSSTDLSKGYDYNALIRATPDGANAFDPRYGMADLFDDGTRRYFAVKFLF